MSRRLFPNSQFLKQHFVCFVFEVDKAKETYPVTGKMHVKVPADVSDKELQDIENVLAQTIATSLGCNPKQIKVAVDPETGESTFFVKSNDPTFAEEMQNFLKTKHFTENVNRRITENSENLPQRISENLAINEVNVNSFFRNNIINNFTCYSLKM